MSDKVTWEFRPGDVYPVVMKVHAPDGVQRGVQVAYLTLDELIEHAAMQLSLAMVMGARIERVVPVIRDRLGALAEASLREALDLLMAPDDESPPAIDVPPVEGEVVSENGDGPYHERHALDVPCPTCHVTTGQRCRTDSGNVADAAHAARRERVARLAPV